MASLSYNWAGEVLALDHQEVTELTTALDIGSAVSAVLAAVPGAAPIVGIISAYLQLEKVLVQAVDKGNGVYLTLPYPAILTGEQWLIVPTTR